MKHKASRKPPEYSDCGGPLNITKRREKQTPALTHLSKLACGINGQKEITFLALFIFS